MGYNHGKAEKEWKRKKEEKEKKLKELGCADSLIQEILKYDRDDFLRERRYRTKEEPTDISIIQDYPAKVHDEINTIEDIFSHIADPVLLAYLKKADTVMLNIILLKTNDYEIKEIAEELHLTKNAVYKRIHVFRKNLPKQG